MPRVRDVHGHVVWHVRVASDEQTCRDCGEIAIEGYCVRCGMADDGQPRADHGRNLVPTLTYLQPGEYECV